MISAPIIWPVNMAARMAVPPIFGTESRDAVTNRQRNEYRAAEEIHGRSLQGVMQVFAQRAVDRGLIGDQKAACQRDHQKERRGCCVHGVSLLLLTGSMIYPTPFSPSRCREWGG